MAWEVEYTDQFEGWYLALDVDQQGQVDFVVGLLEVDGPLLKRPYADTVNGSRFPNMKELRVKQPPLRMFFAFDPRRTAILLIGGDKNGDGRFYDTMIPLADDLYAEHLADLEKENGN